MLNGTAITSEALCNHRAVEYRAPEISFNMMCSFLRYYGFNVYGMMNSPSIKNTIKVKQVLKLAKVKVKKSAKKLVIKATLKGKTALKGKKYTAKTNKKCIAKITIKKSVLKKLNVGKKVKYQVTYLKDTVKQSVKVKK